jgi:hypothetical protein
VQGDVAFMVAFLVLVWLVCMIGLAVKLDPRRLRAHAEARRAYVRHLHGWDPDPDRTVRQMRTYVLVTMAVVTLIMLGSALAFIVAELSGALDTT